jgi:cysteine desulfurase
MASVARRYTDRYRLIPVRNDGIVDLEWLKLALVRDRPGFVAVMAVNNETGVVQPWPAALDLCREADVPFFCDAAQWVGKLPSHGLGRCDYLTGCAHKFGGPAGVGFFKGPARLRPLLVGGPQEEGRRAGTENVAGVLAMVAALEDREASMAAGETSARLLWRETFAQELLANMPDSQILGASVERLWNTISVVMPEIDCRQRWVVKLDKSGAAVSTGSACASGKEKQSHVLAAMGLSAEVAGRVLRISSGWETTEEEWGRLLEVFRQAYQSMTGG